MSLLLAAAVLLAPFGAWASMSCDDACPCDAEGAGDHDGTSDDGAHQADDGDVLAPAMVAAADDDCPDDCMDCRCGAGVMLAVPPVPDGELAGASVQPLVMRAPLQRQAPGRGATVFRPPRARI
ncbi:MAG: hypothetical protein RIF41_26055 [Polyangiaceae bacterium]